MPESTAVLPELSPADTSPEVFVAGHLCLDIIPEMGSVSLDALAHPGNLYETGPLTIATGGAVANTGLALHKLGVSTGLMATIGDDAIGRLIHQHISAYSPQLARYLNVDPATHSSYTIVLSPQSVDRIFLHSTGTNARFDADSIDYDVASRAKIVHLGYPPILPRLYSEKGIELVRIMQRLKQRGCVTSLDLSLPDRASPAGKVDWPAILAGALPLVDIFIPSIDEITFMLHRPVFDAHEGRVTAHMDIGMLNDFANELLRYGCAIVGFKLGEYGMFLKTADAARIAQMNRLKLDVNLWQDKWLWHPAFQADVVGTTGAGDSAYAAVLAAMLAGLSPERTIEFACAVGAHNVQAADASSGIHSFQETTDAIASGWQKRTLAVKGV